MSVAGCGCGCGFHLDLDLDSGFGDYQLQDCWVVVSVCCAFLRVFPLTTTSSTALTKSVTSYQLITLNEIMPLIPSSTEENTEFEVPKSFVLCLGSNEQPHGYVCKYRITKVTLFKHATWQSVAMYTGRSSQPHPRSRLLSQKHHGA